MELKNMKLDKTEREILNEIALIKDIVENDLYSKYIAKRLAQLDAKSTSRTKVLSETEKEVIELITEHLTRTQRECAVKDLLNEIDFLDKNRANFSSSKVTSLLKYVENLQSKKVKSTTVYYIEVGE